MANTFASSESFDALLQMIGNFIQQDQTNGIGVFTQQDYQCFKKEDSKELALMGIMGESFSGFMGFDTEEEMLLKSAPVPLENHIEKQDWQKEVLNRIGALLRQRFFHLGIYLQMSVPRIANQKDFMGLSQTIGRIDCLYFSCSLGSIKLFFSLVLSASFSLDQKVSSQNILGSTEGSVIF